MEASKLLLLLLLLHLPGRWHRGSAAALGKVLRFVIVFNTQKVTDSSDRVTCLNLFHCYSCYFHNDTRSVTCLGGECGLLKV